MSRTRFAQLDVARLRLRAEEGDADAQAELGMRYEEGRGVAPDFGEAVKWYRRAAEQDHVQGQNNLAVMYASGLGGEQDYEEALYEPPNKERPAHSITSASCTTVDGAWRRTTREAVKWVRRAAEQGDAEAQSTFGTMYENGHGVTRDLGNAVQWYRRAAEQDYASAQRTLAEKV